VSLNGLNCYWTVPGNYIDVLIIKYPLGPTVYSDLITDSPVSLTITPDPYPTPVGTEYYNFNVINSNVFTALAGFPRRRPASQLTLEVRKTYRITKN